MQSASSFSFFRAIFFACIVLLCARQAAAKQVRVLFIGNSYTYVNNLPVLVSGLATSSGDQLIHSSSAPGGYTLQQHCSNASTLALIAQGNWDFVVLQEQSQLPAFPDQQVQTDVYPFAHILDSTIKAYNPCAKTVFYMTWGRKNGDASNCAFFPPICTYLGMDSLLQLRYTNMADSNDAVVCPVAKVWRYLRNNHPSIELYDTDESHPSLKGSFAAACAFYSVLFGKDPVLCSYNGGLLSQDAATIKNAAKARAYDSLSQCFQFFPLPAAQFSYTVAGLQVNFVNTSVNGVSYKWFFGDADSATTTSPQHIYSMPGSYTVQLIASKCLDSDTSTQTILVGNTGLDGTSQHEWVSIYPNPANRELRISSKSKISSYAVYNALGGAVSSGIAPAQGHDFVIDLARFPPGIYLLRFETEHGAVVRNFVKQ